MEHVATKLEQLSMTTVEMPVGGVVGISVRAKVGVAMGAYVGVPVVGIEGFYRTPVVESEQPLTPRSQLLMTLEHLLTNAGQPLLTILK